MKTRFISLAIASITMAGLGHAKPVEFAAEEKGQFFGLFAGSAYRACEVVQKARADRGLSTVTESRELALAGFYLIDRMLREDWVGTEFPSGYTLQDALKQAGYPNGAQVRAVVRVSNDDLGFWGYGGSSILKAISSKDGFSPEMKAFGYFTVNPGFDSGRVNTNQEVGRLVFGGDYEVMLFGTEAPVTAGRPLVNLAKLSKKYRMTEAKPISSVSIKRGRRLNQRLVQGPPRRYIRGRAKVEGRMPKGIRFIASQARFVGKAQKKGRYKLRVLANYKRRNGENGVGVDGGFVESTVIIRVR